VSPDHFRKVGIVTVRSRSLALRHGSCLLPLKLPFLPSRTAPFSAPPVLRILLRLRGHRQPSGAFQSVRSIRDDPSLFRNSGCDTEIVWRLSSSSKTAGRGITTLARSSNFRSLTDCVRPSGPKPSGPVGVTRFRGWFPRSAPLVCRVTNRCRSPPDLLVVVAEGHNSLRGGR
jgi:hypothetical protein